MRIKCQCILHIMFIVDLFRYQDLRPCLYMFKRQYNFYSFIYYLFKSIAGILHTSYGTPRIPVETI